MERLLMLHLQAGACSAEVLLNGMPVAHVGADGGHACLPVHEYTLTGKNRLELIVGGAAPGQPSPSQPRVAMVPTWARARLVLARQGRSAADPDVRVLVSVEWLAPEGKSYDAPATQAKEVDLPVNFPRWRWLDAPQIDISAPVRRQVIEFLQQLALDLGRGEPDSLLTAAKLRFDELALAYQRTTSEGMQRFRDHLQQLYAAKALKLIPPTKSCCGRCSMDGSSIASRRAAAPHCARRMSRRRATMHGRCGWPWWKARSMCCVRG